AEARRDRSPSLRDHLAARLTPVRGRALAGAGALVAASILLSLFVTSRVRAQALARTLAAMAAVRSAHCTGWRANYRNDRSHGPSCLMRMPVEWWYEAPDRYRKDVWPEFSGRQVPALQLVSRGSSSLVTYRTPRGVRIRLPLGQSALAHYLSPLDFFDQ